MRVRGLWYRAGHRGPCLFLLLQHRFLAISSASESTFFCFLFTSLFSSFLSPSPSLLLYLPASFISPCPPLPLFTPTLHSVFFLSFSPSFSQVPTSWAVPTASAYSPLLTGNSPRLTLQISEWKMESVASQPEIGDHPLSHQTDQISEKTIQF